MSALHRYMELAAQLQAGRKARHSDAADDTLLERMDRAWWQLSDDETESINAVTGLHCFTVWGVWAHAIARLGKRVENRGSKPWDKLLGERVAIHAGANVGGRPGRPGGDEAMSDLYRAAKAAGVELSYWSKYDRMASLLHSGRGPIVTSAIVCTAVLARCEENKLHNIQQWHIASDDPPWSNRSAKYWWHLADVEVLAVPVPCKGAQGFWQAPPIPGVTL